MAKKTPVSHGFDTAQMETAADSIICTRDLAPGALFNENQFATAQAYTEIAVDQAKCGKSGFPGITAVARRAYEIVAADHGDKLNELIETHLAGASALADEKLASFNREWTGEIDDEHFNEVAILHVRFRLMAKDHIKEQKAVTKAAAAAENKAKAKANQQADTEPKAQEKPKDGEPVDEPAVVMAGNVQVD